MTDIKSLTREQLEAQFKEWSEPAYRATQLLVWLYAHRATGWDAMSNLPRGLRDKLRNCFTLESLELARVQGAPDSTRKFLWRCADHSLIESVLIPANAALYGQGSDRHTLCVSTQVGCAYGCGFCASGMDGWRRNLGAHEIVEQALATERWAAMQPSPAAAGSAAGLEPTPDHPESGGAGGSVAAASTQSRLVDNVVVMGMGEPLANYDNLLRALRILNAPWGAGLGARKITISTSGLAPQIRKLADEPEQFRLAVSLHAATDSVRSRLMPVNRKFPLRELTDALSYYQSRKQRMLTFEYILIAGVNDSLDQTQPLAALARKLHAKVNLIPYNIVEGLPWKRPAPSAAEAFLAALQRQKVSATLRREKGHDIDAACGQLRLKTEKETSGREKAQGTQKA